MSTLGYLITAAMFESALYVPGLIYSANRSPVASIADCQSLEYAIGAFFELSVSATSFLFLLRVRAVYNRSKTVTVIFGFLWIAIVGTAFVMIIGIKGGEVAPSFHSSSYLQRLSQPTLVAHNDANKFKSRDTLYYHFLSYYFQIHWCSLRYLIA